MRKTLLIIAPFFYAHNLFSQQDSLLKKFKYRIEHYQAVSLYFDGSSQYSKTDLAIGTAKNNFLSSVMGGGYYSLKSTDKILFSSNAFLSTSFNYSKSKRTGVEVNNNAFAFQPYISVLNKWFSKNTFTELGIDLNGSIYSNKSTNVDNPPASKSNGTNYYIAINTGIGKGRLENVTDMQNALWLYKELQQEQCIRGALTADELTGLGQTITRGNNTRVLDARKRTKFILETVDNYLQQKGAITKTDIRYFSSLNDILFFAFNNPRYSGTEKFIRLTPGLNSSNEDMPASIYKVEHRFTNKSVILNAGIRKFTPSNLVHQNNFGANVKLSYQAIDFSDRFFNFNSDTLSYENKSKPAIKQAGIYLFFEHAIYPNTRTVVTIGVYAENGYQDFESTKGYYGKNSLIGTLNYFISYRTRLTCNLGASHDKNNYYTARDISWRPGAFQVIANAGLEINL